MSESELDIALATINARKSELSFRAKWIIIHISRAFDFMWYHATLISWHAKLWKRNGS
jgi:hypothetical protein